MVVVVVLGVIIEGKGLKLLETRPGPFLPQVYQRHSPRAHTGLFAWDLWCAVDVLNIEHAALLGGGAGAAHCRCAAACCCCCCCCCCCGRCGDDIRAKCTGCPLLRSTPRALSLSLSSAFPSSLPLSVFVFLFFLFLLSFPLFFYSPFLLPLSLSLSNELFALCMCVSLSHCSSLSYVSLTSAFLVFPLLCLTHFGLPCLPPLMSHLSLIHI